VVLFEIVPRSPETYRRETRRSTLIVAATFIVVNFAVDLMYAWIDPRIRLR